MVAASEGSLALESLVTPVPALCAPACPSGVVSSGLTLRPGLSSHCGQLLFPPPRGKFSLGFLSHAVPGESRGSQDALSAAGALPSCLPSPQWLRPGGWRLGRGEGSPVRALVLHGAGPGCEHGAVCCCRAWELCFPSQQRDRKQV